MDIVLSKSVEEKLEKLKLYYINESGQGILCNKDEFDKHKKGTWEPADDYDMEVVPVYEDLKDLINAIKAN